MELSDIKKALKAQAEHVGPHRLPSKKREKNDGVAANSLVAPADICSAVC